MSWSFRRENFLWRWSLVKISANLTVVYISVLIEIMALVFILRVAGFKTNFLTVSKFSFFFFFLKYLFHTTSRFNVVKIFIKCFGYIRQTEKQPMFFFFFFCFSASTISTTILTRGKKIRQQNNRCTAAWIHWHICIYVYPFLFLWGDGEQKK